MALREVSQEGRIWQRAVRLLRDGPVALRYALLAGFALILFWPAQRTLPVMDRDEARFVQASRQMVQSGDPVDIRFQDEPRHKKPVGIYWAQSLAAVVSGHGDKAPLWVWRLPSLLGAVAAVVLVAAVAAPLVGAQAGMMAAMLMAVTLVLGAEARIAKTDALLLATILAAQAALARAFAGVAGRGAAWLFWLSMALSVLVKGPLGPMVVGLTALGVSLRRGAGWLRPLADGRAALAGLLVVLPWLAAITVISDGAFWQASLGEDLLAKAAAGVEGKGAPPGTYLLVLWPGFFPAALMLPLVAVPLWRLRHEPAMLFLLAWLLPSWLLFEAVPTKLVHYTLPLYPALAILAAWGWLRRDHPPSRGAVGLAGLSALPMFGLVGAVVVFSRGYGTGWAVLIPLIGGAVLAAALVVLALIAARRGRVWPAALLVVAAGAALYPALMLTLARIPAIWPTERALEIAAPAMRDCAEPRLTGWGYHEPSLVWRGGRETALIDAGAPLPAAARDDACAIILRDLRAGAGDVTGLRELGRIRAFSPGAGRKVELGIWQGGAR